MSIFHQCNCLLFRVFLGLTDTGIESVFSTQEGLTSPWANWKNGEPNDAVSGILVEDCVIRKELDGTWHDVDCTRSLDYYCEGEDSFPWMAPPSGTGLWKKTRLNIEIQEEVSMSRSWVESRQKVTWLKCHPTIFPQNRIQKIVHWIMRIVFQKKSKIFVWKKTHNIYCKNLTKNAHHVLSW